MFIQILVCIYVLGGPVISLMAFAGQDPLRKGDLLHTIFYPHPRIRLMWPLWNRGNQVTYGMVVALLWPLFLFFLPWTIPAWRRARREVELEEVARRPAPPSKMERLVEQKLQLRRVRVASREADQEARTLEEQIAALEQDLEPEKKPAYRSIRSGS